MSAFDVETQALLMFQGVESSALGDPMTPNEAREALQVCLARDCSNAEDTHYAADAVLLRLLRGYGCPEDILDKFVALEKWYS